MGGYGQTPTGVRTKEHHAQALPICLSGWRAASSQERSLGQTRIKWCQKKRSTALRRTLYADDQQFNAPAAGSLVTSVNDVENPEMEDESQLVWVCVCGAVGKGGGACVGSVPA